VSNSLTRSLDHSGAPRMSHFLKRLFADIDAIIWTLTSRA